METPCSISSIVNRSRRSRFCVPTRAKLQACPFTTTIHSFKPLSRSEAEGIAPNRVDLYTARAGDTWQSIAERQGGRVVKPATLAIMNGHAVNDQPRPGERIKIVVAG